MRAPTAADTKPTAANPAEGKLYVVEKVRTAAGVWTSSRHQLGDPQDERPYWFDLYLADETRPIDGPDHAVEFSFLDGTQLLSEIAVHRLSAPPTAHDGSCR
ncbi:hypothetical protein [Pseudofrankia sp. DC12]|uniref:hypothetical protein n=1 Tax=Pseudofrankia sp. DC12 TaxID=683315 RepID=UPI0005F84447|nr:hypothetical protein [Pseudofrankia sp. DC12]